MLSKKKKRGEWDYRKGEKKKGEKAAREEKKR